MTILQSRDRLLERFDRWADAPEFTAVDLGRFRIVYVLVALSLMPTFTWVSTLPFSFFDAPSGPFQLVWAIPDAWFFVVLQGALVVCLVCLGFGLLTRTMSVAVAVLFTIGFGYSYSFGKIDHSFLIILVPVMLAWAGWGGAVSVDGLRGTEGGAVRVRNYPVRLLAVLIGFAFLTSTVPKILAGWLSFQSQATLGFIARGTATDGGWWLTDFLTGFQPHLLLESLDWATIVVEGGLVFAALNWRAFRIWCALLVGFHVGVALTLGIFFIINLMSYGAFVKWSALRLPPLPLHLVVQLRRWGPLAAPLAGVVVWLLILAFGSARWLSGPGVVALAGAVAAWYLVRRLVVLVRGRRGRTAALAGSSATR